MKSENDRDLRAAAGLGLLMLEVVLFGAGINFAVFFPLLGSNRGEAIVEVPLGVILVGLGLSLAVVRILVGLKIWFGGPLWSKGILLGGLVIGAFALYGAATGNLILWWHQGTPLGLVVTASTVGLDVAVRRRNSQGP